MEAVKTVKMGKRELELGGRYMAWLKESNDLMHDLAALRERLANDGYLLIRGFHDPGEVASARLELLGGLNQKGLLDPNEPLADGKIGQGNKNFHFRNKALEYSEFLGLMNAPRTTAFFEKLLEGECITYDTKWFRAVGKGGFSGAHYDIVYMGRGTKQVYTVWTPMMDIPLEMGGLAICEGSHRFHEVRETYGKADYEKVNGWFSDDPVEIVDRFGGRWATTEFREGDVLIFGMYTMHGSLNNTTDRYRMSADIRYQLKREPFDPRWHGATQLGELDNIDEGAISMENARKAWGI